MAVEITAIICTRNRAAYLRKALRSLIDQTLPDDRYEIIVVDNCSEDNTPQVVAEFAGAPHLRYLREEKLGLSRARNTGWRNARGPIVAYLDDDAVADPAWLENLLAIFASFTPAPAVVGGRCDAIWEAPRPSWLADEMLGQLSLFHWSDQPVALRWPQGVSGCNIAFVRAALAEVDGFREALGRQGDKLVGGEETDVQRRLEASGQITVYAPDALVWHHISANRLTQAWFRRAAVAAGRTNVTLLADQEGRLSAAAKVRHSARRVALLLPRLALMVGSPRLSARFRRQCQVLESLSFVGALWGVPLVRM